MKNIYIEAGVYKIDYTFLPFYEHCRKEEWEFNLFEPNPITMPAIRKK